MKVCRGLAWVCECTSVSLYPSLPPYMHPQSYWWQFQSPVYRAGRTRWGWEGVGQRFELQICCLLLASKASQALPLPHSCVNEESVQGQIDRSTWGLGGVREEWGDGGEAARKTRASADAGGRSGSFVRWRRHDECYWLQPLVLGWGAYSQEGDKEAEGGVWVGVLWLYISWAIQEWSHHHWVSHHIGCAAMRGTYSCG